jgi:hypothetical protein
MLAYLDGILEPQDAQDLSKKIEESKFASDLMHRIRDLMRRLRLAAPSISERGPGLDPNTVAEYLDNTLPSDRVTDFEKVCLESNTSMADIHLAEVAACHQILTLVLGEPAEIDPATRERIYQLPSVAQPSEPTPQARSVHLPPPIPSTPAQPSQIPQEFLEIKTRSKPMVPEYLREPRKKRPWFAIAAGVLAVACLLLIVVNVSRPARNFLARFGLVSPIPEVASSDKGSKDGSKTTPKSDESKESTSESKSTQEPAGSENPKTAPSKPPLNQTNDTNPDKQAANPPGGDITSIPPQPQNPQGVPLTDASKPGSPDLPTNPLLPPVSPTEKPQPTVTGNEVANDQGTPPLLPSNAGSTPLAPETAVNKEALDIVQKPMGRFTSSDQILLRSNGDSGNWERAKGDSILYPQQHLIAFPTYRPAITLSSGLILQMLGGTEVSLLPGDQQSPSGIKIRYGRVVINSVANPGIRLRLVIGDQAGILTFLDADTNVGIEVHRAHVPGTNPEEEASRIVTEIFVTKDRIAWEDGSGKPIEIVAPTRLLMLPQIPPVTDHPKDFPEWIRSPEPIQGIERRASQVMLQSFTPETPAQQKLLELSDPQTRLIEVRRLAVRCLGYLGYFEPMVAAINDPGSKGEWQDYYVKWLREAVERDPQTAAAVREALEKNYNPQAADLYRMLWGYTDKDLIAGEDAKLVKNLDDDNLAVRVLAITNLKYITDKDLGFNPIGTIPQRARSVQIWDQRLKEKAIRNKTDKKTSPVIPEPPAPPPAIDENRT